jgi:hypothetical protein
MELFKRQIQYIEKIEDFIFRALASAVDKYNLVIKDYVIQKQLFDKGEDGKGKKLESYSLSTIKLKLATNRPSDRTTLYQRGIYYASITVEAFEDRFEISSDVTYAKYLVKRYGSNILRPSSENLKEFFEEYFLPNLKLDINGQLAE